MDRRTFVLLASAAATALRSAGASARGGARALGRLRFELDERRRWSLWYYGEGAPVPLVRDAEIVAWVGEQALTLVALEDSSVGSRRPPGGDAVVVRGRANGVWVEAEFLTGGGPDALQAAVTVTVFPDRYLPSVRGVRFFQQSEAGTLAGPGPLVALVNGYASLDPCHVVTIGATEGAGLSSHGTLGLTRGVRGLGLAFDGGEPGEARVKLTKDGLEAVSEWLPTRPLRPEGDASRLRLAFLPHGDGLAALRALFVPSSPVDQDRLARAVAPAGWCSRHELGDAVSEAAVIANTELCATSFDRRFFRYIELDDGYQRSAGVWDTNDKFPHGHAWLTDQIHAKGFKAGLWLAPFAVSDASGIPTTHPEWLLTDATGPFVCATRAAWGGTIYALDGAHPKVQQWLFDLARRAVRDWGYDHLRIDALRWATVGTGHYGGLTHAEAYRAGLGALRDGLGTEAFLTASAAPLQHSVGLVNGMRIGPDVEANWGGLQPAARTAGLRSFYQRSAWLSDPDCLVVRPPLSLAAAEAWVSLVALSGGLTLLSDDLPKLAPERLALLPRTLPTAPVAGRPIDTAQVDRAVAPAVVSGGEAIPLGGPWRFRTGDDSAYGTRAFDEAAWETIAVPQLWAEAGHPDYVGVAWYRTRFVLPSHGDGATGARGAYVELGKIADADETFVNGVKVGQTGELAPSPRGERHAYRRYPLALGALNWGGENVLAVRVWGSTRGAGGVWSVERDGPPRTWVVEGAPRWWTVVVVNWEEEPQAVSLPLAALGITGAKFTAYDVWRDTALPDLGDTLSVTLEPRSARTVAVRPVAARPQVIGTTRHVVQGAIDVTEETWDAATRTLGAKSINLDSRAYAVTLAVPKGLRPARCQANVPCTVHRLETGQVVLAWPAGGDGRDITWELTFTLAARPARPARR
jgi:hypothetical protein